MTSNEFEIQPIVRKSEVDGKSHYKQMVKSQNFACAPIKKRKDSLSPRNTKRITAISMEANLTVNHELDASDNLI